MILINKIKNIGGLLVLSGCCLMSCDFLDVVPPEQASLKDATKTPDATKGFLYSCYAGLKGTSDNTQVPWDYRNPEGSTDEFAVPPLWNTHGQKVAWGLLNSTNYGPRRWGDLYQFIGQCHLFLSQLDKAADLSETIKKEYRAEANFLIAYYHFLLLEYFGPIPITDSYIDMNTPSNEYNGRFHFDYVVNWIAMKLDEAAKDLPASRIGDEWGRATSTIAKAVKARMLLYAASPLWNGKFPYPDWENDKFETPGYGKELVSHSPDPDKWKRALAACKDALEVAESEGGCALMDIDTPASMMSTAMGKLADLTVPVDGVDDTFKKRVILMRYVVTTRYSDGNRELLWGLGDTDIFNQILSCLPLNCSKNSGGTWNNGYSGMSPYLNAVENFYTKQGKRPRVAAEAGSFAAEDTWYESAQSTQNTNIIRLNANREPRFYAWISFDGDQHSLKLNDGNPLIINFRDPSAQGKSATGNSARNYSVTGYLCKKFVQYDINWTKNSNMDRKDYPATLIRLAELYLNLAECYAETGDQTNALKYVNVIRKRAGIPELTTSDITGSMTLIDWIRNERFVELYAEGHRYYDARRWMIAPEVFGVGVRKGLNMEEVESPSFEELNKPVIVQQDFKWENRMYLSPLLVNEVYKNPQMIQAPNY